jgi:glycosyltransferase involved in cell wall biosynthesis
MMMTDTEKMAPSVSIVVPIHNEQSILAEQVTSMRNEMASLRNSFEVLLVENGSTDQTAAIAQSLARASNEIRVVHLKEPDYGAALQAGILDARNDVIVIFNVEFWSIEFVSIALAALQTRALVIGSKAAPGAHDDRPPMRRAITRMYNRCLWLLWGFNGTDTHGMKAFNRLEVLPFVEQCRCRGFVFDTELVLRCERAGLRRLELPTDVRELREPTMGSLLHRVPSVVRNLIVLWRALH